MGTHEHVILVNDRGAVIGTQEKYAAHTSHTPLHLAFSCWLFNAQGECLVTRRAMSKKAWPGVWTNSVCGHPQLDEAPEQALIRRCRFEVGVEITNIVSVAPAFRYCETDPSGIVENELCPVFAAQAASSVAINRDEVMDYQWVKLDALLCALEATPWAFSPWMVMEAREAKTELLAYAACAQQ
ncbi:MAG: isopentenyl-diphosphate Delta-isomerase [Leclercia sp.]